MQYGINDIDEHGLLKPGLGIWLIALFFSRQVFYFPLIKLATRRGRASSGANIDMSWIHIDSVWEIVACLPALAVLVLLFMRKPGAGSTVRSLWSQAKNLLIAGGLAQMAVLLYEISVYGIDSIAYVILVALTAWLLFLVFTSKRLAQVVTEFPQEASSTGA